jgi:thiol-disulfide isomerase/thioredoxin
MSHVRLRGAFVCVFICSVIAAAAPAEAAEISWRTDFRRAAAESRKQQKPLLVEVTASWCGYCHKMFKQTFSQATVADHVNSCFVPVAIDADADQKLVDTIGVQALPTTLVLSPDLRVLKKITGFQSAEQLQRQLEQICDGKQAEHFVELEPQPESSAALVAKAPDEPLGFGGACLTSLRDEYKHRLGTREHSLVHRGVRLQFASAEHLARFAANPDAYWPMWDGQCVVSAVDERIQRAGDPQFGVVYRGRVWFFADKRRQQVFLQSAAEFPSEQERE